MAGTGVTTGSALEVTAMGGLTIAVDGTRVDHQIPQKAALMVVYLADTGTAARRSRLAGLLWSEVPEERARANLRVALTRLRATLGDLVIADRDLVSLTDNLSYDGARITHGDSDAILDRYTGDFLEGIDVPEATLFMDWVDARRASLRTAAMLSLAEDLNRARADHDWDHGTVLAERILDLEPWNEPAHRLLIEAAGARGGRTAALAQYERCVEALDASLGLPPDDETTALAAALRTGGPDRGPSAPVESAGNRIPFELTPFLGRETEVDQLAERVQDRSYRLLTIAGPGGVGKTRVAGEVARQLEDANPGSVVWAALTSVTTPSEFASHLTDLLVPDSVFSLADPLAQLTAAIGGRSLCLFLDNFEQLVDTAGALIVELLRAAPDVSVVLTSRRTLDIAAEDVFLLAGLPTPTSDDDIGQVASVRLFVDRAYRADKSFSLSTDNAADVAALCRLLEGVPLHLELAAARVASLEISELVEHLRREPDLPGRGPSDAPERHQSFDAVFQQSWELLTPASQHALTRLSVARGGFDRVAASVLLESDGSEANHLARMSLLVEERGGRFRFHELLRQSAAARLSATDRATAEQAHAEWYLGLVAAAEAALVSSEARTAAAPLLDELENIREAWQVAVSLGLTRLLASAADGLAHLFELAGRAIETEQMMAQAAAAAAAGALSVDAAADEAFFLRIQARQRAAWSMDDSTTALCVRVSELLHGRPDRALDQAWSQLHQAQAAYHLGDLPLARTLVEESETTAAGVDDDNLRAWSLLQRGRLLSSTSRFDDAADAFHTALGLFTDADNRRGLGQTHAYLAMTYADQNRVWDAYVADRTALELCEAAGNRQLLSGRHENLAASLLLLGDYEQARHHTAEALAMYRRNAEFDMESYALAQHGDCLIGLGDLQAGERDMATGIAMMRDEGFTFGLLYNLPPWIRHLQQHDRHDQAMLAAEELVEIGLDRGADHYVLTGRGLLARSLAADGDLAQALSLAGDVWTAIDAPDAPRVPWPVATKLDVASVFDTAGDARHDEAVAAARETHRQTAKSITDPALRHTYLHRHLTSVELAQVVSERV